MVPAGADPGWPLKVVDFLSDNLPEMIDEEGWSHDFSTAYEIGCEALVKFGQADETGWGATPRKNARLPDVLPRWDDASVSVLNLAVQRDKLTYRLPDGGVRTRRFGWTIINPGGPLPLPEPNIRFDNCLYPAYADPEVLTVLRVMGLVSGTVWTDVAECVLWRTQPSEWDMDVTSDARFSTALDLAIDTIPGDVRIEMDGIVALTGTDAMEALERQLAARKQLRIDYDLKVDTDIVSSVSATRRSLISKQINDLDRLFIRRWRLSDCWLTIEQAQSALEIFHDPLAQQMRQRVVDRLYPGFPFESG